MCLSGSDCVSGNCTFGLCVAGNCSDGIKNGAETDIDCGGGTCPPCNVGKNCAAASDCAPPFNASAICQGGVCSFICNAGYSNCNGNNTDGCEINISNSVNNCGTCGSVCAIQNATSGCLNGQCVFVSCNPGFADCNNDISDGCETNLNTSPLNCAVCGHSCPNVANGVRICNNGVCDFTCNLGFTKVGNQCVPVAVCGDGIVQGGETCDDGNVNNGDGCSSACQVQAGFTCSGSPSVCNTICGDGIKAGAEGCDDGNNTNGDGCTATCQVQAGYICTGSPSVCVPISCSDAVKNGTETDVDCGGPSCPKCVNGKICGSPSDCISGNCVSGFCAP